MNPLDNLHRLSRMTGVPPFGLIKILLQRGQSWWSLPDPEGMAETVKQWLGERPWERETQPREELDPKAEMMRQAFKKWLRKGKIGSNSSRWDSFKRAFPRDKRGDGEELMEILVKEGYLKVESVGGHRSVSVNPDKVDEIEKFVRDGRLHAGLRRVLERWNPDL